MTHHLDDNGTLACVLPHGALFRGAAEGHIREFIIREKNYLDAVIGLPSNIFYGTGIPTCIMVLKKYRQNNDVLFFFYVYLFCVQINIDLARFQVKVFYL